MNSDMVKGSWTEIKGKLRAKWGKFTDDDLETFKGGLETLSGQLQKTYGYAVDVAEREYQEFKASLHAKTAPKDGDQS